MEMVIQYLWKHRMLGNRLVTTDGRKVKVLYAGMHNTDSGPDFMGARLRIGDEEWAGNVEVHVKASDWYRHHHDCDRAYDNVILHVVGVSDTEIAGADGNPLPQTVVTWPESFIALYGRMAEKIGSYSCEREVCDLSPLMVSDWTASLSVERMQQKALRICDTVNALGQDWEWACFATLARALGFGLNSEPLEMTARITPLMILRKHSDDLTQLEALLAGQAGLLDSSIHIFDDYYQLLCREYYFLARKYGLRPARPEMWKNFRTRPQNFPARRIAMLAGAVSGGFSMLSELRSNGTDPASAADLFNWEASGYWGTHYDYDVPGNSLPRTLTKANRELLVINFSAPMLYAYGKAHNDLDLTERAMNLWEKGRAENNRYVRHWREAGVPCRCAADSQAIIQLSREYCEKGRCLECRFGNALLRNKMLANQP